LIKVNYPVIGIENSKKLRIYGILNVIQIPSFLNQCSKQIKKYFSFKLMPVSDQTIW